MTDGTVLTTPAASAAPATPAAPAAPAAPADPATPALANAKKWHEEIADEGLRAVAGKFGSEKEFFGALGLKNAGGAPEKYIDFTVPAGIETDKKALDSFQAVARELGLNQEAAQRLVNFQAEMVAEQTKQFGELRTSWLTEAKTDKDIGGQNFDKKVELGKRAIKKFGTPALSKLLDDFGIGNHPEVIRFASNVGQTVGEDEIIPGSSAGTAKSAAERIFPKHVPGAR